MSLKPSEPSARQQIAVEPGGRFVASGISLGLLIAIAYHLQAYQMVGADGWIMKDEWTIEAKTPNGTVDPTTTVPPYMGVSEPMAERLQPLLEDRFALKTHREMKQMQVYALTIAKDGSKLKAVDSPPGRAMMGPGAIAGSAMSTDQLVVLLNRLMDGPVVNKTGLAGFYEVELSFDPASTGGRPTGALPPAQNPLAPNSPLLPDAGPSIFTAVQEQLGLRLESSKEPIEMLVIDSAQRPSAN